MIKHKIHYYILKLKWGSFRFMKVIFPTLIYDGIIIPFKDNLKLWLLNASRFGKKIITGTSSVQVVLISGEPLTTGHIYRIKNYHNSLNSMGIKAMTFSVNEFYSRYFLIKDYTLVLIWRARYDNKLHEIVETAHRQGAKVIYDLDDYIFDTGMIDPVKIDGIRSLGQDVEYLKEHYGDLGKSLQKSDCFTSPTAYLSNSAKNFKDLSFVLPNGYTYESYKKSALLKRRQNKTDQYIRIGYAGGTLTHQKDFEQVVPALSNILKKHKNAKLTVFGKALELNEFDALIPYRDQIEIRKTVSFGNMPEEIARFDINIAPLEMTPFCQAKSELKYFEAALLGIPTIATPTEPYLNVIEDGINGLLAGNTDDWYNHLDYLISNKKAREIMGRAAADDVLWNFGPEQREYIIFDLINQLQTKWLNWDFTFDNRYLQPKNKPDCYLPGRLQARPEIRSFKIIEQYDTGHYSELSIVVHLGGKNPNSKAQLDLVKNHGLSDLDLIIITEDISSSQDTKTWIDDNHKFFNFCLFIHTVPIGSRGSVLNVAFSLLTSRYVAVIEPICQLELNKLEDHLKLLSENRLVAGVNQISGDESMIILNRAAWAKAGGFDPEYENGQRIISKLKNEGLFFVNNQKNNHID